MRGIRSNRAWPVFASIFVAVASIGAFDRPEVDEALLAQHKQQLISKFREELKIPASTVRRRSLFPGALK